MRAACVCLLSLSLCAVAADAAPAPLPKERNPLPSTQDVENFLRERHPSQFQSVQARGKREWIAVLTYPNLYWSRRPPRGEERRQVYLVRYQGKDDGGRPQFALTALETIRGGR
jgi:hypothetical protein